MTNSTSIDIKPRMARRKNAAAAPGDSIFFYLSRHLVLSRCWKLSRLAIAALLLSMVSVQEINAGWSGIPTETLLGRSAPLAQDNPFHIRGSFRPQSKPQPVPATAAELRQLQVKEDLNCLALNIYFEARSEPRQGKLAVAHVVMNRMASRHFPGSICGVVQQGGEKVRHRCQFSWWCDGQSDKPVNARSWQESQALARLVYWNASEDPTNGALWYHADYVKPYWRTAYQQGPKIGRHIFYRKGKPTKVRTQVAQSADGA